MISIHALREEGDPPGGGDIQPLCQKISIHALREEGDGNGFLNGRQRKAFLSTPSARRATLMLTFFFWFE